MFDKTKAFIDRIKRKRALDSIRESFRAFGFDLDKFTDKEIEQATRRMGSALLPATSFSAEEAAKGLVELGKIGHKAAHMHRWDGTPYELQDSDPS